MKQPWKTRKQGTVRQKGKRFRAGASKVKGAKKSKRIKPKVVKQFKDPLIYEKKYKHWSVRENLVPDSIKWGFDLTDVYANRWNKLLSDYNFEVLKRANWKEDTGGKPVIYQNPDGIIIVAEREDQIEGAKGYMTLGYMRFEAPKNKRKELTAILSGFRGNTILTEKDNAPVGAVASYIKEESPESADFI